MKNTIKNLAVIGLIAVAVNAKAAYSITESDSSVPDSQSPGLSGKTTFTLTFANTLGNVTSTWTDLAVSGANYYTLVDTSGGYFSSLTLENAGTVLGSGVTFNNKDATHSGVYTFVVDWTLSPTANVGDTENFVFTVKAGYPALAPANAGSKTGAYTVGIDVVAVPEPGQALAGAVLLGCGALVFTGRRWIKSQAAK